MRALIPGLGCAYLLLFFGVEEGLLSLGTLAKYATPKSPTNVVESPILFAMSAVAVSMFRRRWRRGQLSERGSQIQYVLAWYVAALAIYLFMPTLPA